MKKNAYSAVVCMGILVLLVVSGIACNPSQDLSTASASSSINATTCACTTSVWPSPTPDPARTNESLFRSLAIPADFEECVRSPDKERDKRLLLLGTVSNIYQEKDHFKIFLTQIETGHKWVVSDTATQSEGRISEGDLLEVLGEYRGLYASVDSLGPGAGLPFIGSYFIIIK